MSGTSSSLSAKACKHVSLMFGAAGVKKVCKYFEATPGRVEDFSFSTLSCLNEVVLNLHDTCVYSHSVNVNYIYTIPTALLTTQQTNVIIF